MPAVPSRLNDSKYSETNITSNILLLLLLFQNILMQRKARSCLLIWLTVNEADLAGQGLFGSSSCGSHLLSWGLYVRNLLSKSFCFPFSGSSPVSENIKQTVFISYRKNCLDSRIWKAMLIVNQLGSRKRSTQTYVVNFIRKNILSMALLWTKPCLCLCVQRKWCSMLHGMYVCVL